MAEKKRWVKVGAILKKKDGNGQYIKVSDDVKLSKDMILNIQNPRKRPGITEDQLAKIPDWVLAEIYIPPAKDSA